MGVSVNEYSVLSNSFNTMISALYTAPKRYVLIEDKNSFLTSDYEDICDRIWENVHQRRRKVVNSRRLIR